MTAGRSGDADQNLVAGSVRGELAEPRLPLGCEPGERYAQQRVVLGRGDLLLLCTDGLVESTWPNSADGLCARSADR